ncbi:MAG: ribonuclease J [Chloroflexi bacterium]|nr:ribonuclease J [Chloroflexota bacterium]
MAEPVLKVIPLSGVGEVGRNMTLFEYRDTLVVVDCGLMFPEADMLGVDLVIPDFEYVIEHKDKLKGIIITHGHEDHHGALPYLMRQVSAPVFATPLTRGLIEVKLKEHGLLGKVDIHTISAKDHLNIGDFALEFFHVCHSIPDAIGVALTCAQGLAVHTGEYKFDYTPTDGQLTDVQKLAELGGRGVLVLLSDSTNSERPGYTPSESIVAEAFENIFRRAAGRVIVSTFASNISRVQQVIDTAVMTDRRVAVVGRSMVENVRMATELGYLRAPKEVLLQVEQVDKLPPRKVAIVCTGTQGEPTSALVRMANKEHRQVKIIPGDSVILSATPIPGNEELVNRTLNNLFRLGARVFYHRMAPVHVSGHASVEEQKLMISLVRPKYFIPIQGEYRHLVLHGELGRQVGIPAENVFVVENGQTIEFNSRGAHLGDQVPGGYVFVDGLGIGDVGDVVLRDRHTLAQDGFFVVIVTINEQNGEIIGEPEIISRGFVYMRDAETLMDNAKKVVLEAMNASEHRAGAQNTIRAVLSDFLYQQTKRRPMILPLVIEV